MVDQFLSAIGTISDVVLAMLLTVVIFYCYRLNKKIHVLHAAKADLNRALKSFIEENERAQQAILQMQENTNSSRKLIENLLREGEPLKHELAGLVKAADGAFKRLERQKNQKLSESSNYYTEPAPAPEVKQRPSQIRQTQPRYEQSQPMQKKQSFLDDDAEEFNYQKRKTPKKADRENWMDSLPSLETISKRDEFINKLKQMP